ncbi:hypothetical protein L484_009693 [Morus notabilis]|uniref:Uncharacterized protein n=1 Tax=Morus notabilis TaxID=981085 RepID=W9SUI5_9ROSA|nr:hypothetical protein L484_009693 [Morus notabilis]
MGFLDLLRFTYARRRSKGGRVDVAARGDVEAGEVEPVRGKKGADMEVAHGAGALAAEGCVIAWIPRGASEEEKGEGNG